MIHKFLLNTIMHKAFKYRLLPNKDQESVLIQWMGCGRWVWNHCLEQNIAHHNNTGKFIFRNDLKAQLPILKTQHDWLKEPPSQALQNRVLDFETALKRVWKQGSGFPKRKSRHIEHHNTLRIDQTGSHIKPKRKYITIPKMGDIRYKRNRPLEGKLKSITIKKENNNWFVICLCQIPDPEEKQFNNTLSIGIDVGVKAFATLSDNTKYIAHNYTKKEKTLKKRQRQLSKKQKGSKNRNKARIKLTKQHAKIKNQRLDFIHKTSTAITKQYCFPMAEDLNIAGMVKNRKLTKAISNQGWNIFINQLHYKSLKNGGKLTQIGRFLPSSKTCSQCGCVKDELSLSERLYNCSGCGIILDRDTNAAINVQKWGIIALNTAGTAGINDCGESSNGGMGAPVPSYGSLKQ